MISILKPFRPRSIVPVLMSLAIIAAGGFAIYKVVFANPYTYKYQDLTTYNLVGNSNGTGMSVDKPTEFTPQSDSSIDQSIVVIKPVQAIFSQTKNVKKQVATIGWLKLGAVAVASSVSQNQDLLNSLSGNSSFSGYNAVSASVQSYAENLLNSDPAAPVYKVSYETLKSFSSSNIKSSAWSLGFTATASDKKTAKKYPDMQGEVISVYGKNAQYYTVLDVAKVNWQPNQAVWQKVFNSLKVDQ